MWHFRCLGTSISSRFDLYGLHALQQEGAGIVANKQGHLWQERGLGLLSDVFSDPSRLQHLQGQSAIGHVRYATAGSAGIENIQPLMVNFSDMQLSLAHNGNECFVATSFLGAKWCDFPIVIRYGSAITFDSQRRQRSMTN